MIFILLNLSLLQFIISLSNGARILVLTPLGSRSHKIFCMGIVDALAERGHQITVVSAYEESTKNKNIKDVIVQNLDLDSILSSVFENPFQSFQNLLTKTPTMCSDTLGQKHVQDLKNEKFDLIFLSVFFEFCYLSLVHHFKVPFIFMSPGGLFPPVTDMANNVYFPSIISHKISGSDFPPSFTDRLFTTVVTSILSGFFYLYTFPETERICRERGLCPKDVSLSEIGNNVSLTILNSIKTLEQSPSPLLPNVIYAGGVHIKPSKPLPKDLEDWVARSGDDGFIYFSLGSALSPSILPEKYRKILVKVFGSLKQRVIWKWSEETMKDLPKNVLLRKWLPQRDILGHSKLRLFITHGGRLSTQEATYNGIPIIGMPMYGDQHANIKEAESEGWARVMDWKDLEEDRFRNLILEVINNPRLQETVTHRSKIMKDVLIPPEEEAVYWVEYLLRHKGAPHISSPFKLFKWYQIYNIDIWILIIFILLFAVLTLWKLFKFIIRKIIFFFIKDTPKIKSKRE